MKKIFSSFVIIISSQFVCAQINFELKNPDANLLKKLNSADSAIVANEFGDVHSLLVIKKGELIFEKYYKGWHMDSLHQLQSATKSVISTLMGCAIQQGYIKNINQSIYDYYSYTVKDELKKNITIEHLLTQQHGLKWNEGAWTDTTNSWRKVLSSEGDWYNRILEFPMDTISGKKFVYSNAAPTLVSGIIQNATKIQIDSFAIKYLFYPLAIKKYWFWQGNKGPKNNGMALLALTSRDMAKIGQLYLQKGKWENKQIIPESFVNAAISNKVKSVEGNGVYSSYDYGYFWWSNPTWRETNASANIYLARGAGGQNIIVWPEQEVVIVITAWNMQRPNKPQEIFDKYILH